MPIRFITFDLDETLWPLKPIILNAEKKAREFVEQRSPEHINALELETLIPIRKQLLSDQPELKIMLTELRIEVYERAFLSVGATEAHASSLAKDTVEVFLEHRSKIEYFPEVENIIEGLANKYHLGAITNGNVRFKQLSISRFFNFYLSAEDVGVAKPDSKIFELAYAQAKKHDPVIQSPEQICHIGDDLIYDVLGANRAGFTSCWYNPEEKEYDSSDFTSGNKKPDLTIRHLAELDMKLAMI